MREIDPELMELKLWQIAFADMVILNKVDLVERERIDKIRAWLDNYLHRYRLIEANYCDVPLEVLLSVGRFDPAKLDFNLHFLAHQGCNDPNCHHKHHYDHDHSKSFNTWSWETDRPLSLEALREAASRLPVSIYRAKGVIYAADASRRRAVLQVVGKRVDISLADEWGERKPLTQIVAIGAAGGIDAEALRERLELCLGTPDGPLPREPGQRFDGKDAPSSTGKETRLPEKVRSPLQSPTCHCA